MLELFPQVNPETVNLTVPLESCCAVKDQAKCGAVSLRLILKFGVVLMTLR